MRSEMEAESLGKKETKGYNEEDKRRENTKKERRLLERGNNEGRKGDENDKWRHRFIFRDERRMKNRLPYGAILNWSLPIVLQFQLLLLCPSVDISVITIRKRQRKENQKLKNKYSQFGEKPLKCLKSLRCGDEATQLSTVTLCFSRLPKVSKLTHILIWSTKYF